VRSFWAGDQEQYWHANDGFASLPRTYISSGLAGWGAMHSDIGGMVYASVFGTRTEELLLRWLEFCAFCDPMMRSHPSEAAAHTLHICALLFSHCRVCSVRLTAACALC
jgi:alpha-glucosidase (family GH31 glycosyl hydrolase)